MSVHSSTVSPRRIDKNRPLDLDHPLLRGVQGFWLPLPHLAGGSRLYDLSPLSRDGGITGATWANDAKRTTPVLDFDGSGDEVSLDSSDTSLDRYTVSWWAYEPEVSTEHKHWADASDGTEFRSNGGSYEFWRGVWRQVGSAPSGEWVFLSFRQRAFVTTLYQDGAQTGAVTDQAMDGLFQASTFYIGRGVDSYEKYLDGRIGPFLIHSRLLSEQEVKALYDQARRGFPDLLRTRTTTVPLGAAGGTSVSESLSVAITTTPNLVEAGQATESASVPITATPALVESAAASEAASVAIATTPNITETSLVDEVVAVGATATPSVAETGEATESASVQSTATPSVTETASVSEAISVGVQATVSIVETVGTAVFESISVPITGSPSVTESTAASESVSAQATATPSISESASASEALSAAVQASPQMTESASATEQIQVTAQAAVNLIETATVTEAIQIGIAATVSITETVGEIAGRRVSEIGSNAVNLVNGGNDASPLSRSENEAEKQ